MAQFDEAKVGQKVWDYNKGWGEVKKIDDSETPMAIQFENEKENGNYWYTRSGVGYNKEDTRPTLFWDEVKIVPPERPKGHIHDLNEPILNGKAEIIAYECRCGTRMVEKKECKACSFLDDIRGEISLSGNINRFLLNQHHTCEKETTNG